MKDLTYSELVETLRSSNEPVIVVIDELYQNKKKVAASFAADAGISPVFPRLQFNPSAEKLEMRRESLCKIGGKPVMFINDYPLACHWERGFRGYRLVDAEQLAIFARIKKENEWIRSAPTKEEQRERADQAMEKATSSFNNTMSSMLKESQAINDELDEKAARIIAEHDEEGFKALQEEYSKESIFKRLQRRMFGK